MKVQEIDLKKIKRTSENYRTPNKEQDVSDLMQSIKEIGLLNPITVKKEGNNYILIAGFRRYNAYRKLKMKTIPANIRSSKSKHTAINLIENMQRENTTSYEVGRGIYNIIEKDKLTIKEAAVLLGLSSAVCKTYIDLYKETPIIYRDKVRSSTTGGASFRNKGFISNSTASTIINLKKNSSIDSKQKEELFCLASKDVTVNSAKIRTIVKNLGKKSIKSELKKIKTFTVSFRMSLRDYNKIGPKHNANIRRSVTEKYKVKFL